MPMDITSSTADVRAWLPDGSQQREAAIRSSIEGLSGDDIAERIESLIDRNRQIHEVECINLNPATNVMNPRAEAALAAGLGSRPSLGYAGAKYEMGLEAIEEIEVIAADLACRVFGARFAEIRVGIRRSRQPLRVHGDVPPGRPDHRAAGDDRRPHHPPVGGRRWSLRPRHPRVPDRRRPVHDRSRRSRRARRTGAAAS